MNEKLDTPELRSILTKDLNYLFMLFQKHSFQLRIAGGAVRDLLMGIKPSDVDLATTATPDEMKCMFLEENLRMINANGEKHGTITVRLNEENFEITTLRIDVLTDGRHAEVKFTNDWKLDANRRDLTINSIFLGHDGTIYDYFNGYEDLKNRRVRFVGEPSVRVREDYLRILRYFRFYGRIALVDNAHEPESLEAIKENSAGLANIAGERIWVEFKKIICGRFADSLMEQIVNTNVHVHIGLPEMCNLKEFSRVYSKFKNNLEQVPIPITMVCTLLDSIEEFNGLLKRMKFSNEEKRFAEFIFNYRNYVACGDNAQIQSLENRMKKYKFILVDNVKDPKIHEKIVELLKYAGDIDLIESLNNWQIPIFPITGETLSLKRIPKGPLFSKILNDLREAWKEEFNLDTSEQTINKLLEKCDLIK